MAAWVDFGYQVPRSLYMAQTLFCSSCDYKIQPYITQWTDNEGRKWGRADLPDYCPRCKSKMDNGPSAYIEKNTNIVEVVRCKDCINHRQSGLCEGWSRYGTINTPDDAFCSYGRRVNNV